MGTDRKFRVFLHATFHSPTITCKLKKHLQQLPKYRIDTMDTKTKIMRLTILTSIILFQISTVKGQTSLEEINLNKGKYKVGFEHYTAVDSSRTYSIHNEFNNQLINRPIPISLWYPTEFLEGKSTELSVIDYFWKS